MFGMHHHHSHRHGLRGGGCGPHGGFGRGRPFAGPFGGRPFDGWSRDGEERGGRGGRRRLFDGGDLRLVLLALIEQQPRHGYDLIREIKERTGGVYAPSPGVVYPTLTLLADMALVEEQAEDGARKAYAITQAGIAHLDEQRELVEALLARLTAVGSMTARTSGGPVKRAMGNLRTVLGQRLGGEEVAPETLHAVAAILDEAAQRIERLA
ncbi:PadR family transcriptional regulator [Sphingomonas sp. PL-96]|uniref:PadR family transcriptional regulator n=1 Tax=Sphingomonas sp. PL-96 TaxID=2887201 RepID=UPI001E54F7BD|nr:PadR family transcriptional regulator [Sphingomonas sp. PL-96]MCC2976357.1 PadR family transcriptional regulator [Sphingomonas sp. PL-96]